MVRKEKLPKDKVQLTVYIERDIYELMISLAPNIYGRYKGALSYIVEEALRQYLYPLKHTQKHTNPKLSIKNVYYQVCQKVKEILNLPYKPDQVPEKIFDLAIMETRGSDPRTIEKWKRLFESSGLIKFLGGFKPNRIVELI